MAKVELIRLAVVDGHSIDRRENHEHIGLQFECQQRTGAVFVDDSRHTFVGVASLFHDGNTATANGDDDVVLADKLFDDWQFHDFFRNWRRHDAPPATPSIFDKGVARFFHHTLGIFLEIKHSDGFRGIFERFVLRIDHHLRNNADDRPFDAPNSQFATNCLLKMIADISLRHCAAFGKRHQRRSATVVGRVFKGEIDHSHLRAIAVSDDHIVAFLDEIDNSGSRGFHQPQLLIGRLAKGIAAKSDNKTLFHYFSVANITALMVCIRFSASSNTFDCLLRNTLSVTSISFRPNFL